jgi:hypothetical protein
MKKLLSVLCILFGYSIASHAAIVEINLSGASSGNAIDAVGASFGGYFNGQTQTGNTISGLPNDPLSLAPAQDTLTVHYFNGENTILPQPNNQGPLAILLDSVADSFTLTMGSAAAPSTIQVDFFSLSGELVHSVVQDLISGYNVYSYDSFGPFSGISFHSTNDAAGLRYYGMSYSTSAVPIPAAVWLFGSGLLGMAGLSRRKKTTTDIATS